MDTMAYEKVKRGDLLYHPGIGHTFGVVAKGDGFVRLRRECKSEVWEVDASLFDALKFRSSNQDPGIQTGWGDSRWPQS